MIAKTKIWHGKRYQYDSKYPTKMQASKRADALEAGVGLIGHHRAFSAEISIDGITWYAVYKRKYSPNK